ncbi:MAG: hypothetical protein AUG51_26745 [Acidobacteria bacterium 13_1_20CM_3_53_8]|nr:MAG: hypothetical protein AUG51_26745 [Acidobacteria bacterium 13_1_20CM_3_53_8]
MFAPSDQYVPQCATHEVARGKALVVWGVVAVGVLSVLALVFLAPVALAHGYSFLALSIYQGFRYVCHQIPERSFYVAGHPLAVCARCTGIYAGLAAGVIIYPLVRSIGKIETPRREWLLLALVPMTVDFSLTFFGVWQNTHLSRFLTGALFGSVAALYIVPGLIDLARMVGAGLATRRRERQVGA